MASTPISGALENHWTLTVNDLANNNSGKVGINTGSETLIAPLHVHGTSGAGAEGIIADGFAAAGTVTLRGAAGTASSPTATQDNNDLGMLNFRGYGTTGFQSNSAQIYAEAFGNFTDSVSTADLVFKTKSTISLAERLRIDYLGVVTGIWNNNGAGNASSQFRKLTQAQYNALTPDADTIYFIVG